MHDASKVLLGTTQSSFKTVENHAGAIPAGKIVRLKSDNTLSLEAADGSPLGISLGLSQSDHGRCPIVKKGTRVPVLLTEAFDPDIGAQVAIHNTTGIAAAKDGSSTYMNAVYASERMTGIAEDGSSVGVALIDMPGGL